MNGLNSFHIKKYEFKPNLIPTIQNNQFVYGLWPLVYIISDGKVKEAYVGETTDAISRMSNHLKNDSKNKLTVVHLITSEKFNKSATLDIESNLIKYLSGDGQYKLLNGNVGLANHTYYQKDEIYWDIFKTIWKDLRTEGITKHSLEHINNSDLFKYSPYKSLSVDQRESIIDIIKSLLNKSSNSIVVEGGAGTGKTILAVFLFKLLHSAEEDFNFKEFGDDEGELIQLVRELKEIYPNPSMALVIPMSSFRNTIKKVFKNIKGLNARMVIGPAEVVNGKFDIIIVDESHRLRKRVNLGTYFGAFDVVNKKLQLPMDKGNELDWILLQGKKRIFFYDENQSIKPSDVNKQDFDKLKSHSNTIIKTLKSQFRVMGGNDYVAYIDKLLNCKLSHKDKVFDSKKYEFLLFDSLETMIEKIKERNVEFGLSRMIAGYSWEWVSKKKSDLFDITIDTVKLKWNSVSDDYINSKNSINEVGCIHTTQGYDLNYAGIIFGNEISYDKTKNELVIFEQNYFDKNGKQSIKDPNELKLYLINIYKTMMLRGIRGTYVYVCDKNLREYFKLCMPQFIAEEEFQVAQDIKQEPFKRLPFTEVKPYINSIPLYNINVAAGAFSDTQLPSEIDWIELSNQYKPNKDHFVCKVIGESMNKVIPNDSWCLFKKDPGGSREGKIVLVEHSSIQDSNYGSGYTVKSYHSSKESSDDEWYHKSIILKPLSYDPSFTDIVLSQDDLIALKVIGIFVAVLD